MLQLNLFKFPLAFNLPTYNSRTKKNALFTATIYVFNIQLLIKCFDSTRKKKKIDPNGRVTNNKWPRNKDWTPH